MRIDRRTLMAGGVAALTLGCRPGESQAANFPFRLSDAEWRRRLRPDQYQVLRKAATERPFSSPLNAEKRAGTFACAGCGQPLFASRTKFESGTGWPSFWAPVAERAVLLQSDHVMLVERTEVLCRRCGGHLGHVFDDGPAPTGKRYCMNGDALAFRPRAAA